MVSDHWPTQHHKTVYCASLQNMDVRLVFKLMTGIFSFKKGSMRGFNLKRVGVSLVMLPFFHITFCINHVFLLLDYVIFPFFLTQKVKKPLFIVSAPRSGTTYLFHGLAKEKNRFTCVKLWEIIFAPSISQKLFFLLIGKIDSLAFSPLQRTIKRIEKIFFRKLGNGHPMSLFYPEEDELTMNWYLTSPYLEFYFSGDNFFLDYSLFDERLSEKQKKRYMRRYAGLVKRHNFVFNRNSKKQFLSKNPFMMSKLKSIHGTFPDAQIININRCPLKVIPSSLNFSSEIYGVFTSVKVSEDLRRATMLVLIHWYQLCEQNLDTLFSNQHLKINFLKLINSENDTMKQLSNFLEIDSPLAFGENDRQKTIHKSKSEYPELIDAEKREIMQELSFMAVYCQ